MCNLHIHSWELDFQNITTRKATSLFLLLVVANHDRGHGPCSHLVVITQLKGKFSVKIATTTTYESIKRHKRGLARAVFVFSDADISTTIANFQAAVSCRSADCSYTPSIWRGAGSYIQYARQYAGQNGAASTDRGTMVWCGDASYQQQDRKKPPPCSNSQQETMEKMMGSLKRPYEEIKREKETMFLCWSRDLMNRPPYRHC
jgi:hypothetical protein